MAVPLFWEKDKAVSFLEITRLVGRIAPKNVHHSPEIIIGIFWEETFFCNRLQASAGGGEGGPGTGFGQIQVEDAVQQIPDVVGHDRKAAENGILSDPNFQRPVHK